MKTIGDRIRLRREIMKMTQEELAKKLGYKSKSSVNKIETDTRNLTQSKIKAIADALDTTPGYIMGWEDDAGEQINSEDSEFISLFENATQAQKDEIVRYMKYVLSIH